MTIYIYELLTYIAIFGGQNAVFSLIMELGKYCNIVVPFLPDCYAYAGFFTVKCF